jgi:hypothetical protein
MFNNDHRSPDTFETDAGRIAETVTAADTRRKTPRAPRTSPTLRVCWQCGGRSILVLPPREAGQSGEAGAEEEERGGLGGTDKEPADLPAWELRRVDVQIGFPGLDSRHQGRLGTRDRPVGRDEGRIVGRGSSECATPWCSPPNLIGSWKNRPRLSPESAGRGYRLLACLRNSSAPDPRKPGRRARGLWDAHLQMMITERIDLMRRWEHPWAHHPSRVEPIMRHSTRTVPGLRHPYLC